MKKYFQALIYGLTALILWFTGLFQEKTIDISMHDTYLVLGIDSIMTLLGFLFLFYSLCTWAQEHFERKPNPILFLAHYLGTVILFCIIGALLFSPSQPQYVRDYSVYDWFEAQISIQADTNNLYVSILILLFLQLLFFANITLSMLKAK